MKVLRGEESGQERAAGAVLAVVLYLLVLMVMAHFAPEPIPVSPVPSQAEQDECGE